MDERNELPYAGTTTTETEDMDQTNDDYTGPRKLRRTRDGRIIAGVASGLGAYVRIDANIIRLILVVATFFGGTGIFIYVAGWLLIPEEGEERSIVENFIKNQQNKQSGF